MKLNWGTAKRLFAYIAGENKALFAVVLVCIFLSTIANVAGSLFLQILIDQYIEPLLLEASPVNLTDWSRCHPYHGRHLCDRRLLHLPL